MEVKSYHLSQFEIWYVEWGAGIIDRGTYEFEKNVDLMDL
jgi:mannose-6-phosphate isomerase-like protein (cupin superfamily)